MRLWHQDLIKKLPRQQLLGQHRECTALRGNGWNKPHSVVNYVFTYNPYRLYEYHVLIMREMRRRGYKVDKLWYNPLYRGKICDPYTYEDLTIEPHGELIYKEHNDKYLKECLDNLKSKNIYLDVA
jgi:uncharacterized protein (TIGR02328 family)